MEGGMSNLAPRRSTPTRAHARRRHRPQGHLGEGWEEVLRLAGKILDVELSPQAEMQWMKHESRSLAEQADAFVKLTGGQRDTGCRGWPPPRSRST
jgi:hypothetical protein